MVRCVIVYLTLRNSRRIRLGTVLSSINPPVLRFSKANYPVPGSGSTVPSETKMTYVNVCHQLLNQMAQLGILSSAFEFTASALPLRWQ